MFRWWGDGRAVIGRVESTGPFLRRWGLKDNKQPALGRGREKGSRLRERHVRRPRLPGCIRIYGSKADARETELEGENKHLLLEPGISTLPSLNAITWCSVDLARRG